MLYNREQHISLAREHTLREIIGYVYNGRITSNPGLSGSGAEEVVYFGDTPRALYIIRRTCLYLLAEAIHGLYPGAEITGGSIGGDEFYCDLRVSRKVGLDDLRRIESEMQEIQKRSVRKGQTRTGVVHGSESNAAASSGLSGSIAALHNSVGTSSMAGRRSLVVSVSEGKIHESDVYDEPHLPDIGMLKIFKLTRLSGAYADDSSESEMLTRIHGVAFATKEAMERYTFQLEEAQKRDHRKLGNEMELFRFDEGVGAGFPIWLPKGSRIKKRIEDLLSVALFKSGYELVGGPMLLKSDLWKKSGHYQNYGSNMYFTVIDEVEYGIKPMNCIGHIKVYEHKVRSHRELPLRFYEYGVVHRHERSGVLHGLLRVREFTQDDAHIFCRQSQIGSEVSNIIAFTHSVMGVFGFSYSMELATRPEKYIGDDETWSNATKALEDALKKHDIDYEIDHGGGAFYGPKIDIKITDAIGRRWQCGTVQIDMNLPQKFDLSYINEENACERPVMIHRAILGSFERFIAILTEHYSGEFPFFIAPIQVMIITVNERCMGSAQELHSRLRDNGIYSELSCRNETISKKIRDAERQKIPFVVVIGEREMNAKEVSVRDRKGRSNGGVATQYSMSTVDFVDKMINLNMEVGF